MAGWDEIPDIEELVEVRGQKMVVSKLNLLHVGKLLRQFPELKKMFSTFEFGAILENESVVDAMIAMSTGADGDDKATAKIAKLGLGEKAEILAKVLELTIPTGPAPFIKLVSACGLISRPAAAAMLAALDSVTSSEPLQSS